jgi:hypothetical protein
MKAVSMKGKNNRSSKPNHGKSYDVISGQTWWCLYIPSCFMWWWCWKIYTKKKHTRPSTRETKRQTRYWNEVICIDNNTLQQRQLHHINL